MFKTIQKYNSRIALNVEVFLGMYLRNPSINNVHHSIDLITKNRYSITMRRHSENRFYRHYGNVCYFTPNEFLKKKM